MMRIRHAVLTATFIALAAVVITLSEPITAQRGQRPGPASAALPEGQGREVVQTLCIACHQTDLITGSTGYDQPGWRALVSTMVRLPDDQMHAVTGYLATNFPARAGRRPTIVAGDTQVTFKEWMVPTLGQRPRDPIQTKDGTIWWAGMFASLIGRLNPETGEMREYKLAPDARPHSIVADAAGKIWYTGNGNATIGRLDPASGRIDVFPMPDAAARDPHTLIFDQKGMLWFTVQAGNRVGRLDPATGAVRLVEMPTPGARPYGIVVSSTGVPWVCYNGSNKLASIDPVTMRVTEYATPTPESRIRRLELLKDDTVFYVDSSRGYLGRFDPRTRTFKEWLSPSGPASYPYALAVVDDIVWYNESNQRPDALVRFDPRTERFQSWPIPSGVGIVRHMRVSPAGNLVIHQSSSNRVGLAIIGTPAR